MLAERTLQNYIGKKLEELGWEVIKWGKGVKGERESLEEFILRERFFKALERINGISLNEGEKREIFSTLLLLPNTIEGIREFLNFVKNGTFNLSRP